MSEALPDRVVLLETSSKARVVRAGVAQEGLPIVTARVNDEDAKLLDGVTGDAVLLKERATTARVRLGGELLAPLPIYKADAAGVETRVRVAEIKDRPAEPRRGLLARLRRRP